MKRPPNINSDQVKNTLKTALVRSLYVALVGEIRWVSKRRFVNSSVNMNLPKADCDPNLNAKKTYIYQMHVHTVS